MAGHVLGQAGAASFMTGCVSDGSADGLWMLLKLLLVGLDVMLRATVGGEQGRSASRVKEVQSSRGIKDGL